MTALSESLLALSKH